MCDVSSLFAVRDLALKARSHGVNAHASSSAGTAAITNNRPRRGEKKETTLAAASRSNSAVIGAISALRTTPVTMALSW